jgi:hypothetical protein
MNNLSYKDIREDTNESIEFHESICDDIKRIRWNMNERAVYSHNNHFVNGRPASLTKENYAQVNNVKRSKEYDFIFKRDFLRSKFNYLEKALKN